MCEWSEDILTDTLSWFQDIESSVCPVEFQTCSVSLDIWLGAEHWQLQNIERDKWRHRVLHYIYSTVYSSVCTCTVWGYPGQCMCWWDRSLGVAAVSPEPRKWRWGRWERRMLPLWSVWCNTQASSRQLLPALYRGTPSTVRYRHARTGRTSHNP